MNSAWLLQVKAIPFLTFDAGGVLELFDHERYDEVVVRDATADALAQKLDEVLTAGQITTVQLTKAITSGQQQWLDFHERFSQSVAEKKAVRHGSADCLAGLAHLLQC